MISKQRILRRARLFLLEMVTIIIGVSIAFWLNQWKEDRNLNEAELKSLAEIKAGLKLDLQDIEDNIQGHRSGLAASRKFRAYFTGTDSIGSDSLLMHYHYLLRDFISVQNSAPYEALKAQGLNLIQDDSLRLSIINTYDLQFEIVEKLEERYAEMQFFTTYAQPVNNLLLPYMQFNAAGQISQLQYPPSFSPLEQKEALLYLLKIDLNRRYIIIHYTELRTRIEALIANIDAELKERD